MKTLSRRHFLRILPGAAPLLAMPRPEAEEPPVVSNADLQKQIKYLRDKQRRDVADLRSEQAAIQRGNYYVWRLIGDRLRVLEDCLPKCGPGKYGIRGPAKGEL